MIYWLENGPVWGSVVDNVNKQNPCLTFKADQWSDYSIKKREVISNKKIFIPTEISTDEGLLHLYTDYNENCCFCKAYIMLRQIQDKTTKYSKQKSNKKDTYVIQSTAMIYHT